MNCRTFIVATLKVAVKLRSSLIQKFRAVSITSMRLLDHKSSLVLLTLTVREIPQRTETRRRTRLIRNNLPTSSLILMSSTLGMTATLLSRAFIQSRICHRYPGKSSSAQILHHESNLSIYWKSTLQINTKSNRWILQETIGNNGYKKYSTSCLQTFSLSDRTCINYLNWHYKT